MPSAVNTQTSTISGSGPALALPGGMQTTKFSVDTMCKRVTAQINAVTSTTGTTLTNITGLSVDVEAGASYAFEAYLPGVATTNGGLKLAIGGTSTATTISYAGAQWDTTTQNANTVTTTKGNAVAAATTVFTYATLRGTIVVATPGTLTAQFAQNAAHADTTSIYVNGYFKVTRIS